MIRGSGESGASQGWASENLSALFTALPAGVAVTVGPDHTFELANELYSELIAGQRELLGMPIAVAMPEIVEQGYVQMLDNVIATAEPFYANEVLVQLDLSARGVLEDLYLSFAVLPIRGDDDEVEAILHHVFDVTAMVRARQDVEDVNRKLEAVIERMPIGVVMADRHGNLTKVNSVSRKFFDVPIEQIGDISAYITFDANKPDSGEKYEAHEYPLARSLTLGEVVDRELMEFPSKAGQVLSFEVSSAPIHDDQGEIKAGVAVFSDITERKGLERELVMSQAAQQMQELMTQVFSAAGDGIVVVDRQGMTVMVNPAALELTGWSAQEMIGSVRHEQVHRWHADGSVYPKGDCRLHRCAVTGEPCEGDGEVFWRKDGSNFPVWYRAYPIFQGGERTGSVEVFRDLTNDLEAEAARRRAREHALSRQKAFELNDTIVQHLAVADFALGLGRFEQGASAVHEALKVAKHLINDWAGDGDASLTRSGSPVLPNVDPQQQRE